MAKPVTPLPPWASAGNYPASLYPLELPWGVPSDVGGDPTPWSGQPRIDASGLIAFAAAGFTPQLPTPASPYNAYKSLSQEWTKWVEDGTSAGDGNAHIMETDAIGLSSALAYEASASFQGTGSTKAPLGNGAVIPGGKEIELQGSDVAGTNGSKLQGGRLELLSGGAPPSATGLGVSAGGELFFGPNDRVHFSGNGWVYATGDQETATILQSLNISATTTAAVVGRGSGSVRVIVDGQMQSNSLPRTLTIDVEEDQTASPGWTDVGTAQTVTGTHDQSDANAWQAFRHERIFSAGITTFTKYRLSISAGGGGSVSVKEVRLRVFVER